ncbi:uncharacterized protein TNCV_1364321 [Trichonephila clavipes]|uniref:Uncharacterized protein n=1 Tax=Trichonephila clavipes TaxID=2585209 RepID=A0A8X6V1G7_TRICX|nr:uncharacterized protein TNCV_1364321 [Trichonephila clavipes]
MNQVTEYNGDQMTREMVKRKGQKSIPSSWSEKDRSIKRGKKERLPYKRSHESRSGGPERKVQKGAEHRVNKRVLSSNYRTNHNLTKFRKKSRKEETLTPTTSGYNLRPRIGKESRPTIERKEVQFVPEKAEKGTTVHTSRSEEVQATKMSYEEVINNGKTRKGEERGQRNPCHWRSW